MLKVYQREYKRRPIKKDRKGLYLCPPNNHGNQEKIIKEEEKEKMEYNIGRCFRCRTWGLINKHDLCNSCEEEVKEVKEKEK